MATDFKTISVRPMTGVFDTLSSADEVGFGNWRVVKNATTRSTRNRQRAGGWRRLFADDDPYNNQDLHDQLIERMAYYDSYSTHVMGGGDLSGYGYPYLIPGYTVPGFDEFPPANGPYCPVYVDDFVGGLYNGCPIFYAFVGYPFNLWPAASYPGACDTGYPDYYVQSYLYAICPIEHPDQVFPPYSYGPAFPLYESLFAYDYNYCGTYAWHLDGCREAITMLNEIVTATGRKLIASTMSRVYEFNQSAGNWRLLADGLGNAGYVIAQCDCNAVRGVSATMGGYFLYTNNVDPASIYFVGDDVTGCDLQSLAPISDLLALGISRAGGVVVWKGFAIFFDITEEGERMGATLIWSDFEQPDSLIESDTSLAGRATIGVGETILAAAPLGNWLILYTDKSIIRMTLVGGEDVFNFERIYEGGNALKYKYSLINAGDIHLFLGESDIYSFSQFDTRPVSVNWITRAAGMIFHGIDEDDARYVPINKDACDLVTGFWSDETHEAFLSWPTGDSICPEVTLRMNLKFGTADFIDHGFTTGMTFRRDLRPTVAEWIEDMGICPRGTLVAVGVKDGSVCAGTEDAVVNPPLYIRNPEEDPDLPVHPRSLCQKLANKSMDDFCKDCASPATLIVASAIDFTLKQMEDDVYYREQLVAVGSPCRDINFTTVYGDMFGFDGTPLVLDEWIPLGQIRCTGITGAVKLGLGAIPPTPGEMFDPCAAAGTLSFSTADETGKVLGWNNQWNLIAYADSVARVVADDENENGVALLDFTGGLPVLDTVLPLTTPYRAAGLFYHPGQDKILAFTRFGTGAAPFNYRLVFLDPMAGVESELDVGLPANTSDVYTAEFCLIDATKIGLLLTAVTFTKPHLIAVIDVSTQSLVVSQFFQGNGGSDPQREFTGICYSCELSLLVVGIRNFPAVSTYSIATINPATLAIVNEYSQGLTPVPFDLRYITSTGKVWGWKSNGYYEIDPSNGNIALVDAVTINDVDPVYHWKIDRFIGVDGVTGDVLVYNPNDHSKVQIPLGSSNLSYYLAAARNNGLFYIHDLGAPYNVHELNVT